MIFEKLVSSKKLISYGKVIRFPHYETIFKIVFIAVLVITFFNIRDAISFSNFTKENGIRTVELSDYQLVPVVCVIIHVMKIVIKHYFRNHVTKNLQAKYTGHERKMRIEKILKWIYDSIYYSGTTIFVWVAFHKEDWYPKQMNGEGQCKFYSDYPQMPDNPTLVTFYLVQLSSHIYSTLELLIKGKEIEIKFWEYLLHHYLAVALIFFSLHMNFIKAGTAVLIVHDISDIFLSLGRSYGDMRDSNKFINYLCYIMIYITWFWARIYVFPSCIIQESISQISEFRSQSFWPHISFVYQFLIGLTCVLYLMHIYWFAYILKVGIGMFKAGRYKNVYDNKENKLD